MKNHPNHPPSQFPFGENRKPGQVMNRSLPCLRSFVLVVSLLVVPDVLVAVSGSPGGTDECREAALHYEKNDIVNTLIVKNFEELAKKGDPRGILWMARFHLTGRLFVAESPFMAQEMARGVIPDVLKLAEKGDREAQFLIGSAYQEGLGVTPSVELAKKWLTLAADAGQVTAINNLGSMVLNGQGFEPDLAKARALYAKAVALGSERAVHNLKIFLDTRTDEKKLSELRKFPLVHVMGMSQSKGIAYLAQAGLILDPDDYILHPEITQTRWHFKADGIVLTIDFNGRITNVEAHSAGYNYSNPYRGDNPYGIPWGATKIQFTERVGNPNSNGMNELVGQKPREMIYRLGNLNFVAVFSAEGEQRLEAWKLWESWAVNYPKYENGFPIKR